MGEVGLAHALGGDEENPAPREDDGGGEGPMGMMSMDSSGSESEPSALVNNSVVLTDGGEAVGDDLLCGGVSRWPPSGGFLSWGVS